MFQVPHEIGAGLHPATRGVVLINPTPISGSWSDVAFHELAHLKGGLDRGRLNRRTGGGGCNFVHPYPSGDQRNPRIFDDFPIP